MKEQYVGDINDYRKYALLRALAVSGANRIGVCWMLTPSDTSSDGGKLAYLSQPDRYRRHDPELFDILAHAAAKSDRRRLQTIEASGAIPGARYFNAPLGDDAQERRAFMTACADVCAEVDLVFFDPDNGLEVPSVEFGRKGSSKYLYLSEMRSFYEAGRSVLVYQHFPRKQRDVFIASCVENLRIVAPDAAIGIYQTSHVVFLLLIHPNSYGPLGNAARQAISQWDATFISGRLIEPGNLSLMHRIIAHFR
ncbi:hypothetical protein VQ045_19940 [Aurantimonas sp. E1-2-R+4]|uniref:hypothetical protein n=1 Tax=Aurantimonas sp. E1-2-R+4 TaxID=3113714 RepID=UPI002F95BB09